MPTGEITQVVAVVNKPWPPVVGGSTIWKSSVLRDNERPWFWHCPQRNAHWLRHDDPLALAELAGKHMKQSHLEID
ncbi:MAG: hypothetical protein KGR26_00395 [Cyanobacteria bacterium REEB65]|nr:hypothetical protein [Cyanobacteria bacterium REEB65]